MSFFDQYERANVSAMRLQGLLNLTPAITSPPEPDPINATTPSIEFEHVHFNYGEQAPVLANLNFKIDHGQTIGLAGFTGAGKSTIIKCLLRFYDVTQGKITINGTDIKAADVTELRQMIALVSQDIYLFHGTIRENIAYGLPEKHPRRSDCPCR